MATPTDTYAPGTTTSVMSAVADPSDAPPRCMLAVDDDPALLRLATRWLQAAGFEVDTASSGEQALAQIHQHRPDIISSDVVMRGLDGFALACLLQANQATADNPVVLMSGHVEGHQDRALARRRRWPPSPIAWCWKLPSGHR